MMRLQDKVMMDKHLATALDLIENAADEINLSKTDKQARFTCGQLVEFEADLLELRTKIYRFKELAKEIYSE